MLPSRITSSCHGGEILSGGSCESKMMAKFQDQYLLKLQRVSEYFVEVWPECCTRCAPFQLTKLESSVQLIHETGLVVALAVS